jgi:hypothetical protein
MSLFRSEEHVERWLRRTNNQRGAILSLQRVWELAKAWYLDPRDPHWKPRSIEETQAVLSSVGLTGDFWTLK